MFALTLSMNAQNEPAGPTYVGSVDSMVIVPSIASRSYLEPAEVSTAEARDKRSGQNKVIIGKDPQIEDDYFTRNPNKLEGKIRGRATLLDFNAATTFGGTPTDPSGAVGPNHYVNVFNTGFRIFDKAGNPLTAQLDDSVIFPGGGCCDLTISYDNAADRWVMTLLGGGARVAVSDGPNPVTASWFVYSVGAISDYQKLSVWSDGYYMTDNTGGANKVWALERDKMLLGDASAGLQGFNLPGIVTSGFYSPQAFNVSNGNLPAAGGLPIVYLQDNAWGGVGTDHVKIWTVDVDWVTPGSSTISAATEIITTPFISVFDGGSFVNLAQPGGGTSVDALQATIMNQAQFRRFAGHNSAVFNFVVDTDAGGGELAGVRWFEFRQDADNMPWTLYQEGTYLAPDGKHTWHASMAMDSNGNIGMGYTAMSGPSTPTTVRISSYYTGRFAGDALGTMTIGEELIRAGSANITSTRYGDYSKIDVDPVDDKTFWFINELNDSGRKNVVGVFKIAPDFNDDVGVVSIDTPNDGTLSNAETVTVTIFNYGIDAQSNIPINLTIDGTSIADEVFAGPLASSTSASYSFTATGDFSIEGNTYTVTATTNLVGDEDNSNDSTTRDITHMLAADIGVIDITAPVSGEGLGMETVTVTIENFGAADQSGFDVSYTLDGAAPVVETVAATVMAGGTLSYSFTAQGDFSAVATHTLSATTLLVGDSDPSNDSFDTTVVNVSCLSNTNTTNFDIGPDAGTVTESIINFGSDFVIEDANVSLNINHTFDGDLIINLIAPDGTIVLLSDTNGDGEDNYVGTTFDDEAATAIGDGTPPYTGDFQPDGLLSDLNGMSSAGDWTLQITDTLNGDEGVLLDWTLQLCGDDVLAVQDNILEDSELVIVNQGNDQFQVLLPTTSLDETLTITVTNMLGQKLLSYNIENENGTGYVYDLDMSYASSGIYLVRIGNNTQGNVKRLIVE